VIPASLRILRESVDAKHGSLVRQI
jgi:hypothetical protein